MSFIKRGNKVIYRAHINNCSFYEYTQPTYFELFLKVAVLIGTIFISTNAFNQTFKTQRVEDFRNLQFDSLEVIQTSIYEKNKSGKHLRVVRDYDSDGYLVRVDSILGSGDTLRRILSYSDDRLELHETQLLLQNGGSKTLNNIARYYDGHGRLKHFVVRDSTPGDPIIDKVFEYNDRDECVLIKTNNESGELNDVITYQYTTDGRITEVHFSGSGYTIRLSYSPEGKLIEEFINEYCSVQYEYDSAGRIVVELHRFNLFYNCYDVYYKKSDFLDYESAIVRYKVQHFYRGDCLVKDTSIPLDPSVESEWLSSASRYDYKKNSLLKSTTYSYLSNGKKMVAKTIINYKTT
jgi:YD repeat-containing protein